MKRILILALCGIAAFYGCKCSNEKTSSTEPEAQEQEHAKEDTCLDAINRYMTELGAQYAEAEYTIPYALIVKTDDSDPDDIKVWGDFWVENYNLDGETLKTVSGGSHPGLMHVSKTADGYKVTGFDAVGDGSDFNPTAKAIFGELYDAFIALQSNDEAKAAARMKSIADFVDDNDIDASYYQDYGWPAVEIED